jgi:hypothetical protein
MRYLITLLILLTSANVFSQVTVFSENMGTPAVTTAIASNTFQNQGTFTYAGTADVRNTLPSSGYTGASGGGNILVTNAVGTSFQISDINTTGFSALSLSFGHHKAATAANNQLVVEVSSDGTTYTPLTYSRPTGTGTISWVLVTATGTIPATSNLRIRFRQTVNTANYQFRIDDVKLIGMTTCLPVSAPVTLASAFSATTFCTSAQLSFTAGNGAKRIAVVSTTNFANTPVNGTAYNADAVFGNGSAIGAGNFVVLNGTGNSVTVTGLTFNTTYYVKVFEYNGNTPNCDESYLLTGVTSFSFSTQSNCGTPQIRSILVDACSSQEGIDELVIIENGANAMPLSSMTIDFPSGGSFCNSGCPGNTLGNNAAYINQLNTQAGCTLFQFADPVPAGGIIVIFTGQTPSYTFNYATQCPSAATYYAVFCSNTLISGRFANSGTGTRDLSITFGANTDLVTYNLASTLGDGTFVDFDNPGNATYRQETNCIYPLSAELDFFDGIDSPEGIQLKWRTLSETDADQFSVEHADYTGDFSSLTTIPCAGNSTTPIDYSFLDRKPAIGLNYYRLKQTDFNGEFFYSSIIAFNHESDEFGAYYLPEQQHLSFSKALKAGTQISVYQSDGKPAHILGLSEKHLSVPLALSPGIWMVRIQELNGQSHFVRLMVF